MFEAFMAGFYSGFGGGLVLWVILIGVRGGIRLMSSDSFGADK